ncbi:MAG: M48 family metallopeptidase [Gammaproteobacteria bacterium]|nr:M48 family metallopeptidase [Gammaproteobacteria bacterium]
MARRLCALLALALLLAGCAAPTTRRADLDDALVREEAARQREIALSSQVEAQGRLSRVAYPLITAAVPFCGDKTTATLGVSFINRDSFTKEFRDAGVKLLGVGEAPRAIFLVPEGPAARAGMAEGDVLLQVAGREAPTGEGAAKALRKLLDEALEPGVPAVFKVRRDGAERLLNVTADAGCDSPVALVGGDAVNAYADGENVYVTRGMLRFVDSDRELALVVAHEIAHNAMLHVESQRRNDMFGSIFDILAAVYGVNTSGLFGNLAAQTYSKEFEAEADYIALYIMARAGVPADNAANFWRRMAAEHPSGIRGGLMASHPASPERFLAIEKTLEEIAAKRAAGQPLEPEYKPGAILRREPAADGPRTLNPSPR